MSIAIATLLPVPTPLLISAYTYKITPKPAFGNLSGGIKSMSSITLIDPGKFFYSGTQPKFVPKEYVNKGGTAVPIR
jgi:hypothetical protein